MDRANEDISNIGLSMEMDQNKGLETQIEEGMGVGLSEQDRVLTTKKKLKKDRGTSKEKGNEVFRNDESIANLSLSDSDISNRRKVILKEAQKTWEVGEIWVLVCEAMRRL
ncbi:hypothetical protein ES332_D11G337100v1 [Gossypium tomentosum]|uniref:Uncharacterized protein n=1 Tax=Gossypium tomentosum TaxID=34277 RepID=A0A5D2IUV2_GOSTO|nr:hypothetical protein ES332_D11G337100v1 [Gossypium tomentosum]